MSFCSRNEPQKRILEKKIGRLLRSLVLVGFLLVGTADSVILAGPITLGRWNLVGGSVHGIPRAKGRRDEKVHCRRNTALFYDGFVDFSGQELDNSGKQQQS
jgi:hypothetical protein